MVENSLLNSDDIMLIVFKHLPQEVYEHLSILSKIAYGDVLSDKLVFYKHELPEALCTWAL